MTTQITSFPIEIAGSEAIKDQDTFIKQEDYRTSCSASYYIDGRTNHVTLSLLKILVTTISNNVF